MGETVAGAFRAAHAFAPQPYRPPLQWPWVAVPVSVTPYRSQSQLHQVEGPCTCTALRTLYQKHQNNNNSFCKDIMKLYEKFEFRVHRDSLASGYWRRCSFHWRFLLNFGGVSTSGSERQMEQVSEQGVTAIQLPQELPTTLFTFLTSKDAEKSLDIYHFPVVTDHQPAQESVLRRPAYTQKPLGTPSPLLIVKCYCSEQGGPGTKPQPLVAQSKTPFIHLSLAHRAPQWAAPFCVNRRHKAFSEAGPDKWR